MPYRKRDLDAGGKLQVLQVKGKDGNPVTFTGGDAPTQAQVDADITSAFMRDLHTYGNSFDTTWVTVHDTAVDGTATFNANSLAKAKGGTPFKRPENGQFRPADGFTEFFFTETGDTNLLSGANGPSGASYGGLRRRPAADPAGPVGEHRQAAAVLPRRRRRTRASTTSRSSTGTTWPRSRTPARRCTPSAARSTRATRSRSAAARAHPTSSGSSRAAATRRRRSTPRSRGFGKNEDDNEITGIHLSDGDPSVGGLIGTDNPRFLTRGDGDHGSDDWRLFWTQQHGDNITWEVLLDPH